MSKPKKKQSVSTPTWSTSFGSYTPTQYTLTDALKRRMYESVSPLDTYSISNALRQFLTSRDNAYDVYTGVMNANLENRKTYSPYVQQRENYDIADEALAQYLQIPVENRHSDVRFNESKYQPGSYSLPLTNRSWQGIIEATDNLPIGKNTSYEIPAAGFGETAVGRNYDQRGEYRSYGDRYDLNPFKGQFVQKGNRNIPILKNIDDLSFGIGAPFDVYDRMYLDDYYGVPEPTHATWLPEVIITPTYRKGKDSGIHIKPENRGKFNALKKRTGKTTEELMHSKNPLTRKRAIFAQNAKKWKH